MKLQDLNDTGNLGIQCRKLILQAQRCALRMKACPTCVSKGAFTEAVELPEVVHWVMIPSPSASVGSHLVRRSRCFNRYLMKLSAMELLQDRLEG